MKPIREKEFPVSTDEFPVRAKKFPVPMASGNLLQHTEIAARIDGKSAGIAAFAWNFFKIPC
jgi:hypothetical protein